MRPSRDEWAMELALTTAKRATCLRRQVGCVLLNARGHVLATGYNGVASGLPHCNQHDPFYPLGFPDACAGAHAPSGTNLDGCQAIHAEQNALLQCRDVYTIHTAYVTASPCVTCCKLLLNTSCERIVYGEEYPHSAAKELWLGAGRVWQQYRDAPCLGPTFTAC
jgi:dCMP deaminase